MVSDSYNLILQNTLNLSVFVHESVYESDRKDYKNEECLKIKKRQEFTHKDYT